MTIETSGKAVEDADEKFVPNYNPPDIHVDLTKTEGDKLTHFAGYPYKYCGWLAGGMFWLTGSMVA